MRYLIHRTDDPLRARVQVWGDAGELRVEVVVDVTDRLTLLDGLLEIATAMPEVATERLDPIEEALAKLGEEWRSGA